MRPIKSAHSSHSGARHLSTIQLTSLGTRPTFLSRCNAVDVAVLVSYPDFKRYDFAQVTHSIRRWISEDQLWTSVGLQAQSLTWHALDQSTSIVQFTLAAVDQRMQARSLDFGDIRDLSPPTTVPVLHISHIDIELVFHVAESSQMKGWAQSKRLARSLVHAPDSFRFGVHNDHEIDDQHDATIDHCKYLSLSALQQFFGARPTIGSRICVPRMFKSSSLADLAPGVFLPEYPKLIKPRQKLIPSIAKLLAAFKSQQMSGKGTTKHRDYQKECSASTGLIEEKLWSSMVSALRMPSRAQCAGTALELPTKPDRGTYRLAEDAPIHNKSGQRYFDVCPGDSSPARGMCDAFDWPPLFDGDKASDDDMLILSSVEDSDQDAFWLNVQHTDEESFGYSHDVAAKKYSRAHFGHTSTKWIGTVSKAPSDAELSKRAECPELLLTHGDEKGKIFTQITGNDEGRGMIGQNLLTHESDSTQPHLTNELAVMDEDILIPQDPPISIPSSRSKVAIETHKGDDEEHLYCQADRYSEKSEKDQERFVTDEVHHTTTMASQHSRHSLTEVLGGDRSLWNIWKRRGSAAPSEGADMLEMHNMFENDPDMRLLTSKGEEQFSCDESMLFESFNFSRKSTQSSDSSRTCGYANTTFEEPLEDCNLYSQATRSTCSTESRVSTPKKSKRRASVLQKFTQPLGMSEDDILFQQSSPTREVDIKKRKTLLEYHAS